jgi:hypothetical protein
MLIAVAIAAAAPVGAAPRNSHVATATAPRVTVGTSPSTLGERGGWGLFVGILIIGLALRRRRVGPVVTN